MKLINKTIVSYLFIGIPLLLVAGICSYFIIKTELRDGMDENLEREKFNAQHLIESLKDPSGAYLGYDSLSFIRIINGNTPLEDIYYDTLIENNQTKEHQNYRVLKSIYNFKGTAYQITLARTTLEEDELMGSLFSAFVLIIVFLVLSFFMVSWLLSKKLWQPFYKTLSVLGSYDVKHHEATQFDHEPTTEFEQLNAELNKMTEKIHRDFIQQKEFTENASHEMQTPLAVVRANVSLLMQSPNLREPEMNQLAAIEGTIKKLAALNKTLLLLAKIENNQYHESIAINLREKISLVLGIFMDLAQAKNISVVTHFEAEPVVTMNAVLAEILITNLLQNAIRHNAEGGKIRITTTAHSFSVANSGSPLAISEEDLFVRFKKNDGSKDSLGLGLSIVKSIADLYSMTIRYSYTDNYHTFTLNF